MGVFRRGKKLWLRYKDVSDEWVNKPTPYFIGQEREADVLLKKTERNVRALVDAGVTEAEGPLTVKRYGNRWLERRTTTTKKDDEGRLKLHVFPRIGDMLLNEVRPRHVRELVQSLVASKKPKLAPRTVRNVYGVLHTMFHDAQVDELIDVNPCVLKRGDLPKKVDKDPTWRSKAIYAREEIERLISDEQIPEDRRVINALLAVAGLRFGEAAALRWSSYEADVEPLGKLLVAASYNVKKKIEKSVKTERPREVPVHPTLAAILATWKLGGWERLMGRPPRPDDLLVPSRLGNNRSVNHALKKFHEDCERIGIRPRRQHDMRRTFISLARADGARKDILEFVSHGPRGDIVDVYTTLPWAALCEELAKLKIKPRQPAKVIQLPVAQAAAGPESVSDGEPEEARYSARYNGAEVKNLGKKKARNHWGFGLDPSCGVDGTRKLESQSGGPTRHGQAVGPRSLRPL